MFEAQSPTHNMKLNFSRESNPTILKYSTKFNKTSDSSHSNIAKVFRIATSICHVLLAHRSQAL